MKQSKSDSIIAWLTLFSGLCISAVAVYYSVAGLMSIFAAAAIPIMIMGIFLESSKLVATVWLKRYWSVAPTFLKTYLCLAVIILMFITSLGIFGYLSKAHSDQALPLGNVISQIEHIDSKIKTHQDNILSAKKSLEQLDNAVDQTMGRSTNAQGATNAIYVRRTQTKERTFLNNEISIAQDEISKLNDQKSPLTKELRTVEAEVGPLKYIAALIYGDSVDNNMLEASVRWVIILIVIVFDPLAVVLLLTSQYSFQYISELPKKKKELPTPVISTTEIIPDDITEKITNEIVDNQVDYGNKFVENVSEKIDIKDGHKIEIEKSEDLNDVLATTDETSLEVVKTSDFTDSTTLTDDIRIDVTSNDLYCETTEEIVDVISDDTQIPEDMITELTDAVNHIKSIRRNHPTRGMRIRK
jgi:hypothetical protein